MFRVSSVGNDGDELPLPSLTVVEPGSAFGPRSVRFNGDGPVIEREQLDPEEPLVRAGRPNLRLWSRLVREAQESDLYLGDRPETWSPLGSTNVASAGGLASDLQTALAMLAAEEQETGEFRERNDLESNVEVTFVGGVPVIGWRESGVVQGAAALGATAVIVPIPAGSSGLTLEEAGAPVVENDLLIRAGYLTAYAGSGRVRRVLLWRLYRGSNSSIVDGTARMYRGGVRVEYPAVDDAAYIVARPALLVGGKRTRSDPFMRTRIAMALKEDASLGYRTVQSSPRINHALPTTDPTVIAVHGTMGTAIPMAREIERLAGTNRILRFEHDTWHGIRDNSDQLANQIDRIGSPRVLLVAHSRGGLVARRAMDLMRRRSPDVTITAVTLGTPFSGTPLIYAARGGLIGLGAALGALRLLTGGVLDPISRLTSLLLRSLPAGIDEMRPDSPFFAGDAARPPDPALFAVAGDVDAEGSGEVWGVGMSALHGIARAAFGRASEPNDLVVPTRSATADIPPGNRLIVGSDHFSYFLHEEVQRLVRRLA